MEVSRARLKDEKNVSKCRQVRGFHDLLNKISELVALTLVIVVVDNIKFPCNKKKFFFPFLIKFNNNCTC